ncbi:MAG: hydrolase [Eubacteriales bacterium]
MRIKVEDTLLLVVDIQEKLVPAIWKKEELVRNCGILIEGLRALEVPMLVTQQYTRGLGETIPEIAEKLGDFTPIDKTSFSCCGAEGFWEALEATGRKTVLLCGMETHICVLQTALDLLEKGYQVLMVEDCLSSRREEDKKMGMWRAVQAGAQPTTYESVLFELLGKAGSPAFKTISRLIR